MDLLQRELACGRIARGRSASGDRGDGNGDAAPRRVLILAHDVSDIHLLIGAAAAVVAADGHAGPGVIRDRIAEAAHDAKLARGARREGQDLRLPENSYYTSRKLGRVNRLGGRLDDRRRLCTSASTRLRNAARFRLASIPFPKRFALADPPLALVHAAFRTR